MDDEDISSKKPAIFLGVDIAGQQHTCVAGLSSTEGGYKLVFRPKIMTLEEIRDYCLKNNVLGVAIDAQLTADLKENNGFRFGDGWLQDHLPNECSHWVVSANWLSAVPTRGRLLADHLAPLVGTIIETHPRVSLLFALGRGSLRDILKCKPPSAAARPIVRRLWRLWTNCYRIQGKTDCDSDDALDALVCASVVALLHARPSCLCRVPSEAEHPVGRGPFYVVRPNKEYLLPLPRSVDVRQHAVTTYIDLARRRGDKAAQIRAAMCIRPLGSISGQLSCAGAGIDP